MAEIRFITDRDKLSPISEAYRAIRTNLQFAAAGERQVKTIGFTSALPSEGKSTTVSNLAIVIAQDSKRVLLIDDIVTTGSTLSECARVLGKAGAEQVVCATVARAAD